MALAYILGGIAALAALALIIGGVGMLRIYAAPSREATPKALEMDGDVAPLTQPSAREIAGSEKFDTVVRVTSTAAIVCGVAVLGSLVLGAVASPSSQAPTQLSEPAGGPRNYSSDLYARLPAADVRGNWDIYLRACLTNEAFRTQIDRLEKAGFSVPSANAQNSDRIAFDPQLANTIVYYDDTAQEAAETVSIFLEREMSLHLKAARGDPALIPENRSTTTLKIHLADPRCRSGG